MDCEPVSADLTQSGVWGLRPPLHKGIPALAGYYEVTVSVTVGKKELSYRGFPEARPAYWEAPETLRPPHIVEGTRARKVGVYFRRDRSARYVSVSPAETQDARKVGVSPGEMNYYVYIVG